MKKIVLFTLPLVAVCALAWPQHRSDRGVGWLEGVVVTDAGLPVFDYERNGDLRIRLIGSKGTDVAFSSRASEGGFYTLRDIQPGVYDVLVSRSTRSKNGVAISYRPQHIFGVVVRPDVRTTLRITVSPGTELEEVGKPLVRTQDAMVVSEALASLQRQIDELRKGRKGKGD